MTPPLRCIDGSAPATVTFPDKSIATHELYGKDGREYTLRRWNEEPRQNQELREADYFIRVMISPKKTPERAVGEMTARRFRSQDQIILSDLRVLVFDSATNDSESHRANGLSNFLYHHAIDDDVTQVHSWWEKSNRTIFLHRLCQDNFDHIYPVRDISQFTAQWSELSGLLWRAEIMSFMNSNEFSCATLEAGKHTPSYKALNKLGFELAQVIISQNFGVFVSYQRQICSS